MEWNWLHMPEEQLFLKEEWQQTFNEKGYIVLDGLSPGDMQKTKEDTRLLIEDIKDKAPKRYFPVGQLMDFELRNRSSQIIGQVLPAILGLHFRMDRISYYSGTHLIKPRGRGSFLTTHQDSSLVDETRYHSLLMWCPLQDTNYWNGRLYVLEGSHRFGNIHRSTTIPWAFSGVQDIIFKHSVPLTIREGQVCYFHSGLIHHSGHNILRPYRIALSSLITSKDAPLINFFRDAETPEGMVELYETDMDYFHNFDFNRRPDTYKKIGMAPQRFSSITASRMMELIQGAAIRS